MKIVYSLISDYDDLYCEQAIISAWSARHYNPEIEIILITDVNTKKTLTEYRATLLDLVNKTIIVDIPQKFNLTKRIRSRYIKTNIRQFIDGTILILDTDTIVLSSVDELSRLNCQIGAVYDKHQKASVNRNIESQKIYNLLNIPQKRVPYYNTGILLVRDSVETKEFYNKWFEYWTFCVDHKLCIDQPVFFKVCTESNIVCKISDMWHAQIFELSGISFLDEAKILHLYNVITQNRTSVYDNLLNDIKNAQSFTENHKQSILKIKTLIKKDSSFMLSKTYSYSLLNILFLKRNLPFKIIELCSKILLKSRNFILE